MKRFIIMPIKTDKTKNKVNLPNGVSEDPEAKKLVDKYIGRASKNLELMNIISELSKNQEAQKALNLSKDYSNDEWIIIISYYAMYTSALALLGKFGYKSSTHTATIIALEMFFVKKEILGQEHIAMLKHIHNQINEQDITDISHEKQNRETAQYDVTKSLTHSIAESSMKNAQSFVNKVKEILLEN